MWRTLEQSVYAAVFALLLIFLGNFLTGGWILRLLGGFAFGNVERCWPTLFALQILWTLPAKICQDTDQAKPRRVALAPHTWATSIYSDFEYCGEGRSCKVRFFDGGGGVSAYASA